MGTCSTCKKANDAWGVPSLIADLIVSERGMTAQTVTLLDIRVVDTEAPSYSDRDVAAILPKKRRRQNIVMLLRLPYFLHTSSCFCQ